MPVAISEKCIPATFEEAREVYEMGKDVVISIDGNTGETVSKTRKNQQMRINDWSILMQAKWYVASFPCHCHHSSAGMYPLVKENDEQVFEICPQCKGTIKARRKETAPEKWWQES